MLQNLYKGIGYKNNIFLKDIKQKYHCLEIKPQNIPRQWTESVDMGYFDGK